MDRKMNIAMLGHKRIPSREGGIEIVVEELASRMVERGHSVTCYSRKGHHVSGAEFDSKVGNSYRGIRIKRVPTINRRGFAALSSSLFASLRSAWGKYDVVHIHAEGPAAMCLIPKLHRKSVVVTIHGLDWGREKWSGMATKYIKYGEKQAVKYADQIIVLSRSVQEYFKKEYGRDTIYIPNGANQSTKVEAEEITKRWNLKKDDYVLFLGRMVPEKGLRYLVDAWKGIKTDKKLVIAGGSSDTQEFINDLKKKTGSNVIFTGFRQGRILEELYSNAYLFCLPSDLEGMPLSLLEAMSYGNCCLVSDIPECTEVVEDKAVTFRKSDANDLRKRLQELLDNPQLVAEYKAKAAEFITKKYNWDDVVDQTLEVYRKQLKD